MKSVEQIMITGVMTIEVGKTAADAVALMLDRDVSVLPVVDGERLVGLITMRDLLRTLPYRPIAEVMQRDVTTASIDMPITRVYALMEDQRVDYLPVVDDGRLVGMVTLEGVLRALGLPVDPLTELAWGTTLRERAVQLLKSGSEIAILFLDLDNFGIVNKRFGHVVGDRCIKSIAGALQASIDHSTDILCRYGGDEFAILTTRRREDAEALGRRALEIIPATRPTGLPQDFTLSASMGIAGGKRTTERQDIHFEATVDDLITIASRQTTQAKMEKSSTVLAVEATRAAATGRRLRVTRVSLTSGFGEATTIVELGLGTGRFVGEAAGPDVGMTPWRLLAEATVQAVNNALPEGWRAVLDDVRIIPGLHDTLVVATVHLGLIDGASERHAGCVLAGNDLGQAVVRATLHAINRRVEPLLEEESGQAR